jgi:hypothetical protein
VQFTAEQKAAIDKLCPNADSLLALERSLPPSWYSEPANSAEDYRLRLRAFVEEIFRYLINMAAEIDELPDEASRLRDEATGLLLAIRNIYSQFPELDDSSNSGTKS